MLRDGDQDSTTGLDGLGELLQHELVFVHVLDDVESPDDVELPLERNPSRVHPIQSGVGKPASGGTQASEIQLATVDPQAGKAAMEACQDEARCRIPPPGSSSRPGSTR